MKTKIAYNPLYPKVAFTLLFAALAPCVASAQVATRYSGGGGSLNDSALTNLHSVRIAERPASATTARYYTPGISNTQSNAPTTTVFSVGSQNTSQVNIVPVSYNAVDYQVQPVQLEQPRAVATPANPQYVSPGAGAVVVTPLTTTSLPTSTTMSPYASPQTGNWQPIGGACCTPGLAQTSYAPTTTYLQSSPPALLNGGTCAPGFAAAPPESGYKPLIALRPYPCEAYVGQGLLGQPKAYMPQQPIRNFFRYLLP